ILYVVEKNVPESPALTGGAFAFQAVGTLAGAPTSEESGLRVAESAEAQPSPRPPAAASVSIGRVGPCGKHGSALSSYGASIYSLFDMITGTGCISVPKISTGLSAMYGLSRQ
ncbi:hypothetical protein SNE32_17535, partial [Lysobacter sp. D1-1-M9]|uniref:hypothetical protein n=1 Tax=Novilysobacter longmucuonensis TaxID=3098603 RepID=UPI002FC92E3A